MLKLLRLINKWLPKAVSCVYPLVLGWLLLHRDAKILRVVFVPAAAFGTVTIMRKLWNFPRPYEMGINPLIPREKNGQSFPSRHTASAAVIAAACLYISLPLGAGMLAAALLIALVRVLAGIHFPKDVIAGLVIGLVFGFIGFWLI